MSGLANNNNPFQSQVRVGPQYIQLVAGPQGPPGVFGAITGTGLVHVTSGSVDGAADIGGAGAILIVNAGGTDVAWVALGPAGRVLGIAGGIPAWVVPTISVQHNGVALPLEQVLNFLGGNVVDDPGNASTDVTLGGLVGPGAAITGNVTLAASQTFSILTDGPYTVDMRNVVAGFEYIFLARGTGTLGAGVTFSQGTASFLIEDPETSESGFTTGTSVNVHTDWTTYGFALDTTANLLRSTR